MRAEGRVTDYVTATGRFDILKYTYLTSPHRTLNLHDAQVLKPILIYHTILRVKHTMTCQSNSTISLISVLLSRPGIIIVLDKPLHSSVERYFRTNKLSIATE